MMSVEDAVLEIDEMMRAVEPAPGEPVTPFYQGYLEALRDLKERILEL